MPEFSKHIDTFPLEHLFRRLELAGFKLSPADRLRALQILGGPATAYLDDPAQLKQLLAPVLVRSEAEQAKFYEVFDQYYLEITAPWEPPELEQDKIEWWKWLLILPILALLAYAYYALADREIVEDELTVYIEGPDFGQSGDTVVFSNKTQYPENSTDWGFRWSFINVASQQEELSDSTSTDWEFIVPNIDSGAYLREIRLLVYPPDQDTVYEARQTFSIFCREAPVINGIQGDTQLEAEQETTFSAIIPESYQGQSQNWAYSWDFGDGEEIEGAASVSHTFRQNGQYTVRVTVIDSLTNGFCSTAANLEVKVGREQAFIPLAELHSDRLSLLANWGWGFYLILAILGISLLYYWVRWLTRKSRIPEANQLLQKQQEILSARFTHSDKAPYFIPLRNQNSYITTPSVQLRLADALRLRQEGLRRELDLAGTLNNTIEKGGYPEIAYKYATQPSEYLCLIDEQSGPSHLGQLFRFLATSLKNQDVNLEIYFFRTHFNRFWNQYYPQGRTLDQLQRAYGGHRLLVMGDLHDLINPYARKSPNLRSAHSNVLRQWSLRLLLTPVPPVSWSYREKLLARVFNVFPSDSQGLAAAALHIENDGELLPDGNAFNRWHNTQIAARQDADTEHRNWRRWRNIKEYLSSYGPDLARWFCALAVFPVPSWEMTIAIGRALDMDITYDNLLYLARIPALQSDRFDERLRREMMAELSFNDEEKARKAIQKELSEVQIISEGSYAHRELEAALAVQEFALAPYDEEHQQTMRFMLQNKLLTPAQEADLDRIVDRLSGVQKQQKVARKMRRPKMTLRQWLNDKWSEEEVVMEKEDSHEDSRDLKRAILLTAVYLALLVIGWKLGGSEHLYRFCFGEKPTERIVNEDRPLRDYFFIKEKEIIDSAIIYNNRGVSQAELGTLGDTVASTYFRDALRTANSLIHGNSDEFNGQTISYGLANTNLSKLYFNAAIQELNGYLSDSLGMAVLPEALDLLDIAYRSDSTMLDIWHARGVIHYYAGSPPDSSLYYFQLLDSLDYFSRLNYTPNLETLMGRERSRIISITTTALEKQQLEIDISYFVDNTLFPGGTIIDIIPQGIGVQPASVQQTLEPGQRSIKVNLFPKGAGLGRLEVLGFTLIDVETRRVIDTYEYEVAHNWIQVRSRPQAPPQQQGKQPENAFQLKGEVIDASSRVAIGKAIITVRQQATRVTQNLLEFSTSSGSYGEFTLNGDLENYGSDAFELVVEADGYEDYRQVFQNGNALLKSVPYELPQPIRLQREIPRPRMVTINGGGFLMGDDSGKFSEDEQPVHEVSLGRFYMGTYEVTFAEFDLYCEATGYPKPDDNGWGRGKRPVINISWYEAVNYCNWLSQQHGYDSVYDINPKLETATIRSTRTGTPNGYRLPTEAEWEYAARGGIMLNRSHIYAGGTSMNTLGWYVRNSEDQTHPVGQLRPNNAGTYDMSGNVWEWCHDWFGGYVATEQTNPFGPDYGSHRVIRGGAWLQKADDCRVSVRQFRRPEEKTVYIGFRLVRG